MTFEARLAFILFFFLCWAIAGVLPWAVAAVLTRGRGALIALPLALASACAAGVFVPLVGAQDATGFWVSLFAALLGGAAGSYAGLRFARRLEAARPAREGATATHPIGERRRE